MRNLCIHVDKCIGVVHTLQILQRCHCEGAFLRLKQSPLIYPDVERAAQKIKDLGKVLEREKEGRYNEQSESTQFKKVLFVQVNKVRNNKRRYF